MFSSNMIVKAEEKWRELARRILCSSSDMQLKKQFSGQRFDFIFSNFVTKLFVGNELNALSQDLLSLLKPGGRLVLVMMSRNCVWKIFIFLKGNFSSISRRRKRGNEFKAGNRILQTYYYSPGEIMSLFGHGWQMKTTSGRILSLHPICRLFSTTSKAACVFSRAMDRHFSVFSFCWLCRSFYSSSWTENETCFYLR